MNSSSIGIQGFCGLGALAVANSTGLRCEHGVCGRNNTCVCDEGWTWDTVFFYDMRGCTFPTGAVEIVYFSLLVLTGAVGMVCLVESLRVEKVPRYLLVLVSTGLLLHAVMYGVSYGVEGRASGPITIMLLVLGATFYMMLCILAIYSLVNPLYQIVRKDVMPFMKKIIAGNGLFTLVDLIVAIIAAASEPGTPVHYNSRVALFIGLMLQALWMTITLIVSTRGIAREVRELTGKKPRPRKRWGQKRGTEDEENDEPARPAVRVSMGPQTHSLKAANPQPARTQTLETYLIRVERLAEFMLLVLAFEVVGTIVAATVFIYWSGYLPYTWVVWWIFLMIFPLFGIGTLRYAKKPAPQSFNRSFYRARRLTRGFMGAGAGGGKGGGRSGGTGDGANVNELDSTTGSSGERTVTSRLSSIFTRRGSAVPSTMGGTSTVKSQTDVPGAGDDVASPSTYVRMEALDEAMPGSGSRHSAAASAAASGDAGKDDAAPSAEQVEDASDSEAVPEDDPVMQARGASVSSTRVPPPDIEA